MGIPDTAHRSDPHAHRYAQRAAVMARWQIPELFSLAGKPEVVSLAGGMPDLTALDLDGLAEEASRLIRDDGLDALQYGSPQGIPALREQICEISTLERIHARADDVVVTAGSQMGLDLITRTFCDPGDVVIAEAPCYVGALSTFAFHQADVVHVEMDAEGLVPDALRQVLGASAVRGRRPKFLYSVPNFHNPAGVTLAVGRRAEIMEICAQHDLLVVEDNPYGLLGFDGRTYPALRAIAPDNVIYLSSFSKILAPGLRVGWVLAPPSIRERLFRASESAMLCPSGLTQYLVSYYMNQNDWKGRIECDRETYRIRRDAMLTALARHLPTGCSWTEPDGGFYVWLTVPEGLDTETMLPHAIDRGVTYVPGTAFHADRTGTRQLRLAYCRPTPEQITEGVRRLGTVFPPRRVGPRPR
ncbi:PLP-dependent aminotransferase family protein [Nocardia sp. BMG51109]|uniref:aminotransferase-like domain-containing protein n=1 Tax=Nocardia sp. BMG51109 TaxID=1056816 RepID=UPI0004631524|nr:PLP-dependent aminotransferase family protein [Nocardia sp. BMG51109]